MSVANQRGIGKNRRCGWQIKYEPHDELKQLRDEPDDRNHSNRYEDPNQEEQK